jgi:hypothetical protein
MTFIDMDLLQELKREHSLRNTKRPHWRSAYTIVNLIVKRHGLTEDFVAKLTGNATPNISDGNGFTHGPLKRKKRLEALPFSLSTRKDYLLTKRIIQTTDNPYLRFAHSPDEIILSAPLFRMNPTLPTKLLERQHFETLFLSEQAKARIAAYVKIIEDLMPASEGSRNAEIDQPEPYKSKIATMKMRIRALEEFIQFIENTNRSEGQTWVEN